MSEADTPGATGDRPAEHETPECSVKGAFAEVFAAELQDIYARREGSDAMPSGDDPFALPDLRLGRQSGCADDASDQLSDILAALTEEEDAWREADARDGIKSGLIGVALSGGGIRSSTFNLGVLQAIDNVGLFPYVDYLSTVSGGGYIGSYVTTSILEDALEPPAAEPHAPSDRFPLKHCLGEEEGARFRHLRNYSSFLNPNGRRELLSIPVLLLRGLVVNSLFVIPMLLGFAIVVAWLMGRDFDPATTQTVTYQYQYIETFESMLAPATQALFADTWISRAAGSFPVSLGVLGILLLSFVLYPVFYALKQRFPPRYATASSLRRQRMATLKALNGLVMVNLVAVFVELQPFVLRWLAGDLQSLVTAALGGSAATMPFADKILVQVKSFGQKLGATLYGVLGVLALWVLTLVFANQFITGNWQLSWMVVFWVALFGLLAFYLVDVNAISIHKYYRDRLVRAFVAQAAVDDTLKATQSEHEVPKLSAMLAGSLAPYQLINAAVNVARQEIRYKNGRNASFFFFSPRYCGGIRTQYVRTETLEQFCPDLDVGTAMAISGAAIAPNMGRYTNRFVAFILAILNVRLNYWLPNPAHVKGSGAIYNQVRLGIRVGPVYLLREMFGFLDPEDAFVNLSDGGHIENTGVYELLRRQCRLIIAGDGECDPSLTFEGLSEVIRLARIDFGYDIDMRGLDEIRSGDQQYAMGIIRYSPTRTGRLLYIKSNLGGDYNLQSTLDADFYRTSADRDDDRLFDQLAYVAHYRQQHPDFPQESTGDQFFDETQFENYRALGYRVAASALHKQ